MPHLMSAAPRAATFRAGLPAAFALFLSSGWALAAPTSIDLPGATVYPESLSSSKDGTLYVGDIADGGVLRPDRLRS